MSKRTVIARNQNNAHGNADLRETTIVGAKSATLDMGIADDAYADIINILSDMSSNRGQYALREAYSNAYDATCAAGDMTRAIEIELPRVVSPEESIASALGYAANAVASELVVRDHGCGMDTETVLRAFTQYGGSRKRGRKMVGSKGLGSKAPFACSDQFSVRTVKDGVETFIVLERRADKNVFSVPEVRHTDAADGTEVRVPVTDAQIAKQMRDCAAELSRWNLDANLVIDGKPAPSILGRGDDYVALGSVKVGVDEDGKPVSFRMWERECVFPTHAPNIIDIVIGGVRYRLDKRVSRRPYYYAIDDSDCAADLIVAGDPGYLNFDPSRDGIVDDEAKSRFVSAVRDAVADHDFEGVLAERARRMGVSAFIQWAMAHGGARRTADGMVIGNGEFSVRWRAVGGDVSDAFGGKHGAFHVMVYDRDAKQHFAHLVHLSRGSAPVFMTAPKGDVKGSDYLDSIPDLMFRYGIDLEHAVCVTYRDDEELRSFLNSEAQFRAATFGDTARATYLFVPKSVKGAGVPTKDDKAVLGHAVKVVKAADALKTAKDYRRANRAVAKRDLFADAACASATVDLSAYSLRDAILGKRPEIKHEGRSPLAGLADGDACFVLTDGICDSRIADYAAYAKLLVACGLLRADKLVFAIDLKSDMAKRLAKRVTLLDDARSRITNRLDNEIDRLAAEGYLVKSCDLSRQMPIDIDKTCGRAAIEDAVPAAVSCAAAHQKLSSSMFKLASATEGIIGASAMSDAGYPILAAALSVGEDAKSSSVVRFITDEDAALDAEIARISNALKPVSLDWGASRAVVSAAQSGGISAALVRDGLAKLVVA